jgi:hypothetical protein
VETSKSTQMEKLGLWANDQVVKIKISQHDKIRGFNSCTFDQDGSIKHISFAHLCDGDLDAINKMNPFKWFKDAINILKTANFDTEALWFFSVFDEITSEWITIHRYIKF